jgi:hypothetical protein
MVILGWLDADAIVARIVLHGAAGGIDMFSRLLLASIRVYQRLLSPLIGGQCRFYPTCSRYAAHAIAHHGSARGSYLTFCRLARCHPGCQGGHDPVPERFTWTPWRRPPTDEGEC